MNFEGGMILGLGLLFTFPLLLLLPRLVNWLAGRKVIPLWSPFVLVPAALIGGSLYLDSAGKVTPVKVIGKQNEVRINYNGNWHRRMGVLVEYTSGADTIPTPVTLGCDSQTYDSLHVGQTVEARVLEVGSLFKFARLKDRSTLSMFTWLLPREPQGPWQQATATVREVKHITSYSHRNGHSDLKWPYDVVELSFVPAGRTEPVSAVDVVEAASLPPIVEGQQVAITWPVDDPRAARIVGARPGRPWANWFYDLGETIVICAVVLALLAGYEFFRRSRKKRKQAAHG
jgi:hypothetical protein